MSAGDHIDDRMVRTPSLKRFLVALTLVAIVVASCALFAPAAMADATYAGGPRVGDFPLYVANDHTVNMVRFQVPAVPDGQTPWLLPSTEYYVKVRLSPTVDPAPSTGRGFTWNPASEAWVQERAPWSEFPTITSTDRGSFSPTEQWFAFKFGDVTKAGTYYLLVSLRPVGAGAGEDATLNNLAPPAIAVVDPAKALVGATPAFWVHNGAATEGTAGKRVDAIPVGGLTIWSLSRIEPNLVDDDGDGVVDNEDHGPAGVPGDFSLAVPAKLAFNVRLGSAIWPSGALGFSGTVADVDIAYGAEDQTPPAAVAGLTATAGDGAVSLTWNAAADADGVTGYRVYRWTDPAPVGGVIQYTPQPLLVATTAEPGYQDDAVANGERYHYLVRAADAATNVGRRSGEVAAVPGLPTTLALKAKATVVAYNGTTILTVRLTDALAAPLAGRDVAVQKSLDGITWTTFATVGSDGGTVATPALTRAMHFRAVFAGAEPYGSSTSASVLVKAKVALGRPIGPDVVKRYVNFAVYGSLKPRHTPGWNKAVKLYCYKKNVLTGEWILKKTAWCKTVDYSTYSRYKVTISLPAAGSWKLRAYAPADAQHAATWSSASYLRVK